MEEKMGKTGLVIEGGGMKCAYSAGVLDAFLDHDIHFDYVIGVSAGSANGCSFVAGQRERNKRFYTEHPKEPGYFGVKSFLKTGNLFGLDYIYSTLSNANGGDPLDYQALVNSPTELEVVATNALTGEPTYFNKDDIKQDDYTIIKASSALPAACKPIRYKGKPYYDGGISDAIPVKRAFDQGCDKVVIIMSKTRDFVKEPEKMKPLYHTLCRDFPATVKACDNRHLMYTRCQTLSYLLEEQGKAFIFAPSKKLKMGTFSMDLAVEEELYELGLSDFEADKEKLLEWLS